MKLIELLSNKNEKVKLTIIELEEVLRATEVVRYDFSGFKYNDEGNIERVEGSGMFIIPPKMDKYWVVENYVISTFKLESGITVDIYDLS